jgi:hypothetical protein
MWTIENIHDRLNGETVLDAPQEITEGVYWYFLEMMPPMHWRAGSFCMCEADSETEDGVIRSRFSHVGTRWFHEWICIPFADDGE